MYICVYIYMHKKSWSFKFTENINKLPQQLPVSAKEVFKIIQ